MLLSEAMDFVSEKPGVNCGQEALRGCRTTEAINVTLGHPLVLNDKPLVLKTSHAQSTRHREYKLALT